MDHQIIIQQINSSHVAELAALAKDIYQQHYLHLWHEGGADWYMNEFAYSENKLKNELNDPNVIYCIAYQNKAALGYVKININAELKGFEPLNGLEVERIYLFKNVTGKGIGKQLMQFAFTTAQQYHKDFVFLKAMDSSQDAINFYKCLGFNTCGSFQLPMPAFQLMKEQFRGMIILKKNIS